MEPLKATAGAVVITGDLNAPPDEELHVVAGRNGFASTHKVYHSGTAFIVLLGALCFAVQLP
jgi:hypothetical protein